MSLLCRFSGEDSDQKQVCVVVVVDSEYVAVHAACNNSTQTIILVGSYCGAAGGRSLTAAELFGAFVNLTKKHSLPKPIPGSGSTNLIQLFWKGRTEVRTCQGTPPRPVSSAEFVRMFAARSIGKKAH